MKNEILHLGVGYDAVSSPHFCIMPSAALEVTSPHLCIMAAEGLQLYREPLMNIRSTGDSYTIELEMPGVVKNGIKISLTGRMLEVEGVLKAQSYQGEFTHRELASSLFSKGFEVPSDCDGDHIHSELADGILIIKIPRKGKAIKLEVG